MLQSSFLVLWIPAAFINGKLSWFILIVGVVISVFVNIAINGEKKEFQDKRLKEFEDKIRKRIDTKHAEYLIEPLRKKAIVLEPNKELFHFIFDKKQNDIESINFKDVLEVHIVEDGTSITKTSRGSQIGGALVGGVLAGGVGAIIGGLSGEQMTTKQVKKIELTLLVNDTSDPIRRFTFFNHHIGVKTTDKTYIQMKSATEKWYNRFKVIIHNQDKKDEKVNA